MQRDQLNNKKGKKNIDYWERVLRKPTSAYAELFRRERDFLLQNIEVDDVVLDLGCGDGRNIRTVLERTMCVVGLDNDVKAIQDVKNRFGQNSYPEFVCGDIIKLPFEKESFDVSVMFMVFYNLQKKKMMALREVYRVLKRKGILLIDTFSETALKERMKIYKRVNVLIDSVDTHGKVTMENGGIVSEQFSLDEMRDMLAGSGFTIEKYEKIGSLAYCIRAVKI